MLWSPEKDEREKIITKWYIVEVREEYFEVLYNINTAVCVVVNKCGFDGARRDNYFWGEPISKTEMEIRVKTL